MHASAAPGHALWPGAVLHWGAPLDPAAIAPGVVLFVFTLPAAPASDPGVMLVSSAPLAPDATARVAIALNPAALGTLLAEDLTVGADRIRRLAATPASPPLRLALTPGARLAVESIHRCPFTGASRQMAFSARAHDLLLEFFTALAATIAPPRAAPTRAFAAQIHAAAEILKRDLEHPPSLTALARAVGLSETTLKRGFHPVFGTTVFGYLRTRRMERARALLACGEATVLEAAALVGYSNPSNFAAAFRREFGLNPKEFQLTVRRQ